MHHGRDTAMAEAKAKEKQGKGKTRASVQDAPLEIRARNLMAAYHKWVLAGRPRA